MKNKKILAYLLSILMIMMCICGLTACRVKKCNHQWGDWTITINATCLNEGVKERVCNECEEIEKNTINPLGHTWKDATCLTPKTCINCSETEGTALGHRYTEQIVKTEALKTAATCTDSTVYYKSCVCGVISTSDTDVFTSGNPESHHFTLEIIKSEALKTAASCISGSVYYKSCECGAISSNSNETFSNDDALEHLDEDKNHNCDYDCNTVIGEHFDLSTDNDHVCDYGCSTILENCIDNENDEDHNCDICNKVDVSSHSYSESTCGIPQICSECGMTTGIALEHKDENFDHLCDNECGKNDIGIHADSNIDKDHLCDYGCGSSFEACFDSLSDEDHICDVCEKENVTSHVYVENTTLSTQANCEFAATKTYECNCGDSYVEEVGDSLGHSITGVEPVERYIENCKYVLVYICQANNCGKEILGEYVYHHNYVASISTPSTCSVDGLKIYKCKDCDDTSKTPEVIPADITGHKWIQGNVVDGTRTDNCDICNATKLVSVFTGNTTDSINAGNLENKEIELNNANIMLDSGVIQAIGNQNVVLSADKLVGDDRNDIGLSIDELAQVGNNPIYNFTINNGTENISNFNGNWVTITIPYALGENDDVDSIAIWFISDEGELESIKATYNNGYVTFKTNHFSYYTVTRLTPTERCNLYGHNYISQHVVGNCTKDEYDLYVCVRCHDKKIDENTYIFADGHDYLSENHNPTCIENGYISYLCKDCNHYYEVKINPIGHSWNIIDSLETSCSADGYIKYACSNCGDEYVITYPKLTHTYNVTNVEATCTENGYKLYDCKKCDYSYKDSYVDPIGHNYESSGWLWSVDYSSATLTFICEHNGNHIARINAAIEKTIVNGACSNFTRTTYVASLIFERNNYIDEKVVEIGTPDHIFSSDLKYDANSHWYECTCGEKKDVIEHNFENITVTKEPTCGEDGENISYCLCGMTETNDIPATGDHIFVDGICSVCETEYADTYYLNLVRTWKNIDGFSIRIQNFSYEVKEQDSSLLEQLKLIGSIKQLDIAELELFFTDGELSGAAIGSVVIFNGPISNNDAICEFKAVIHDGYIYISLKYGKEVANKTINTKISVDAFIEELIGSSVLPEVNLLFDFYKDIIILFDESIIENNAEDANLIFKKAFNIIFSFKEQEDGSFVATIDYDKLHTLNENLATKSISEIIDIYFDAGTFNDIKEFILEILDVEIQNIPEYIDEKGLNSEEIFERVNALIKGIGPLVNYDVRDIFESKNNYGKTLGMVLFVSEDTSYIDNFNELFDELSTYSFYELMSDSEHVDTVKNNISEIIDIISNDVNVSFITDNFGMLTAINLDIDEFSYESDETQVNINVEVKLTINDRINVTWNDIIDEIENSIVPPPNEEKVEEMHYGYGNVSNGFVNYNGVPYSYSNNTTIIASKIVYEELSYIIIQSDCNGWNMYSASYPEDVYKFTIAAIDVDGEIIMLLIDEYNNEVVELKDIGTGIVAIYDNKTTKNIPLNVYINEEDTAKAFANIYFAVFENPKAQRFYDGDYLEYYYNFEFQEYSNQSHHELETIYELEGEKCSDGCIVRTTCKNCDYSTEYTRESCYIEDETFDASEYGICEGTMTGGRCIYCGFIYYMNDANMGCTIGNEVISDILDHENNVIGTMSTQECSECGLSFVSKYWIETESICVRKEYRGNYVYVDENCIYSDEYEYSYINHNYEYSYDTNGCDCDEGYIITKYCSQCDYRIQYESYGHIEKDKYIDLNYYSMCYGYIYERWCEMCDKELENYIYTTCNWEKLGINSDGYIEYQCYDCGATKLQYTYTSEKDDECIINSTNFIIYSVNENEIYRREAKTQNTKHNYIYEFEMYGSSCYDGYLVRVTCIDCGDSYSTSDVDHSQKYIKISIDEKYGCCSQHNIRYYECACGEEYEFYFDPETLVYYNDYNMYYCNDCGACIVNNTNETKEECSRVITTTYKVIIGNSQVFSVEHKEEYESHNFKQNEVVFEEDKTKIVSTCKKCNEIITKDISLAKIKQQGEYYEYVFVPEETGLYTIQGLSGENYVYIELYYEFAGQLIHITSHWGRNPSITNNLTKGEKYVYVIGFDHQNYVGNIYFTFTQGEKHESKCGHNSTIYFAKLLPGAETCEEGLVFCRVCKECGQIILMNEVYEHYLFAQLDINYNSYNEEYDCCSEHYIYYSSCVCGENWSFSFDESSFDYDEVNNKYICSDCELSVSDITIESQDDCLLVKTRTFVVYIGENELLNIEESTSYENHNFVDDSLVYSDGKITIVSVCGQCDEKQSYDILNAELIEAEGYGRYHFDYYFIPQETGYYIFSGYSINWFEVELYEVTDEGLNRIDYWYWYSHFEFEHNLKAGSKYVYRFICENSTKIYFSLNKVKNSDHNCDHNYRVRNSILLENSISCEDGSLSYYICKACGKIADFELINYHVRDIKDNIDLSEKGACYGEFVFASCACGQEHYFNINHYNNSYDNSYYDNEGKYIQVNVYECNNCGLIYTCSYYSIKDKTSCKLNYYYTIVIYIDDGLILDKEYIVSVIDHDFEITSNLSEGMGSSCEDGVTITYSCKDCSYEKQEKVYYHRLFEKEVIDLADYGSVCGGYVTVSECLCGLENESSFDHTLCDFYYYSSCSLWIEEAITEDQYNINGVEYYDYNSYIYCCSVTNPEMCAYKYRYASYWLQEENTCVAYHYKTWQFGYNPEDGTYKYEITLKDNYSKTYHNYEKIVDENGEKYLCHDCGSYYLNYNYYNEDGQLIKTVEEIENNLNDGHHRYIENITEYSIALNGDSYVSRRYNKTIYSNETEYWWEELCIISEYISDSGDTGYLVRESYSNSYGDNSSEEKAYVIYNDSEYLIYTRQTNSDGSSIEETNTYDENYNRIKTEQVVKNPNAYYVYQQTIYEYSLGYDGYYYTSRQYYKNIDCYGEEFWEDSIIEIEIYTGDFGEPGEKTIDIYMDSTGTNRRTEIAYVYYKGHSYTIYSYEQNGDYWSKYDYTYSFEDECIKTISYTDSDGHVSTSTSNICKINSTIKIKEATCTQDGIYAEKCGVCENISNEYKSSNTGHSFVQIDKNFYICSRCLIENTNGVSGDIIMEDLTKEYGNDENYVVGYFAKTNVDFTKYISLVLEDKTEVIVPNIVEISSHSTLRAFVFNKLAVDNWAEENGYSNYLVKFSFVPTNAGGSLDYAITFTDGKENDNISNRISFIEYLNSGEEKTYIITPTEDGIWTFTSFAQKDTVGYLYDENDDVICEDDDSGYNNNFKITYELEKGKNYKVKVRFYSSTFGEIPLIFYYQSV